MIELQLELEMKELTLTSYTLPLSPGQAPERQINL